MTATAGPIDPAPVSLDKSQMARMISMGLAHSSCKFSNALAMAMTSGPIRVKAADFDALELSSPVEGMALESRVL